MHDEKFDRTLQIVMAILTAIILIVAAYYIYILIILNDQEHPPKFSNPGDFAKLYLQDEPFNEILIEVDYVEDQTPNSDTLEVLKTTLEEYCDKEKIYYQLSNSINNKDTVYSVDEIYDLEKEYRDYYNSNDTAVIYILYLNGRFEDSDNTLGLSYLGSSFAIFKDKIDSISIPIGVRPFVSQEDFENSVVIHETGHLLGLVNINYQSIEPHEDLTHESPHHCKSEKCVMHFALEYSRQSYLEKIWNRENNDIEGSLKPPKEFDQDCAEDLEHLKHDVY
jgi:predicted Zn-dependent protease